MNEERVRIITASIREQDAAIETLKEELKEAKEQREETLQQLLAEIERKDDQTEMSFKAGSQPQDEKKVEDAQYEVVDGPKQIEGRETLALPENAGGQP